MKNLFFSSLSEQIGFTLLHSLWQGIIGVSLIILISRLLSSKYSTIRYWLFVSIMLLVFVANLITLSDQILRSGNINESNPITGLTETMGIGQISGTSTTFLSVANNWLGKVQYVLPYFVMLWWLGILALVIRLSINLWRVRQLTRADHLPVPAGIMALFELVKLRLRTNKIIRLVQSKQVMIPSVIGHLKPIILLPIGLVNGLSNDQVEAILLHELSHIKRHDFLVNIIQSIVEVIYFFNPFMWIISKAIRDEREHASDDTAIAMGIAPSVYAETLAGVFNYAINRQQFAMSFTSKDKSTLKRIQRIMKNRTPNNNKLIASMLFVIAITFSMYFGAQSQVPGQDFSAMLAERTAMAMTIPSFSKLNSPVLKSLKEEALIEKFVEPSSKILSDTTDPKALKKRSEEYEKAMAGLRATKEWQEVERVRKDMMKEQMHYLKELTPAMEDALRLAAETMELEHVRMLALDEQLARVSEVMENLQIEEVLARALEMNNIAIDESMRLMEEQLEKMDMQQLEKMAQFQAQEARNYALEAEVMAAEATKMAAQAKKHVEDVEDFFDELNPLLIEDGYIKSKDDLDQLKFKDGEVWINGEKVNAKHAKKYSKIRAKYFAGDDDFIMN